MKTSFILRARGLWPVSRPFLENGALVVADGRIQSVGRWPDLERESGGAVVDLGDALLLPGLVNAHCHLDYTDMAGMLSPPRSFPDWIKGLLALKGEWSYSEYALSWLNGARMLLHTGVTTVADIEAVPELLPEVWTATPLRVISFLELVNIRSWNSARQVVQRAEARLHALPPCKGGIGLSPHAPYTTSPELLRLAAESGRKHGWPLTTHAAESREEFEMFVGRQGSLHEWLSPQRLDEGPGTSSPIRYLARHHALDRSCLVVHANYLADGDAACLASHGASVVHCPRSHRFFRHARFPLSALQKAGVNLCLGTDSLASIRRERREALELNLFSEMRTLAANEPELSVDALVRMATINGARALGGQGQIGELSPGALADVIAIPFHSRSDKPEEAILGHRGAVTASMIGGEWRLPPPDLSPATGPPQEATPL